MSEGDARKAEIFGRHVGARRVFLQISGSELARGAGCSSSQVSEIEAGKYLPKEDLRRRIANALGYDDDRPLFGQPTLSAVSPAQAGWSVTVPLDEGHADVLRALAFLTDATPDEAAAAALASALEARREDPLVLEALSLLNRSRSGGGAA